MFDGHYNDWINSRLNCIYKYTKTGFFKSKSLLELGCGYAHIGNEFSNLGAFVTSSDARQEHLTIVNNLYPHIHTLLIDCDEILEINKYDIILHWGVLYHINNVDIHLEDVLKKCDVLLLETIVSDSEKDDTCVKLSEKGYDQAFNNIGSRPSTSYVEKQLEKNGFLFRLIKDPILNSTFHLYDWETDSKKDMTHGDLSLRRFWVCWRKDTESPLLNL